MGVAVVGALVGLLVQRSAGGGLSGAGAAVVAVRVDLGSGKVETSTGMVLTASGAVLTNDHLVARAQSISVRVAGRGADVAASIVGLDPADDVALLQLQDASGLPVVGIGDSTRLAEGERVTALAASDGGGPPVQLQGTVSGLDQTVTATDAVSGEVESISGAVQVTAPLTPAAIGGPVIDSSGQVVAMAAATASQLRPPGPGGGWAIPIATVVAVAHDMITGAPDPRVLHGQGAVLGIDVVDHTGPPGALVIQVSPGSPAQAAGIAPGDVIVAIGGVPIATADSVAGALRGHRAGDRVTVQWVTASGQSQHATAQLASGTAQ